MDPVFCFRAVLDIIGNFTVWIWMEKIRNGFAGMGVVRSQSNLQNYWGIPMYFDDFIDFRPIAGHPLVRKIICRFFHPNPHGKVVNYT